MNDGGCMMVDGGWVYGWMDVWMNGWMMVDDGG
jgi:hypothetical protein